MDRLIEVRVNGHHLTKDNNKAGVQHESNATVLRITFDDGWDGFAKTVTFWDALGGNPTKVVLISNLLEDITVSTRVYLVKIPGEAMAEAGKCTFVIDGYVDGKRQRSLSDELVVYPAPYADDADEPADPTPTQAEQLQGQIDTLMDSVRKAALAADAVEEAQAAAQVAVSSEAKAQAYAEQAELANRLVDDSTGTVYRIGADNGELYLAQTDATDPAVLMMEGIEYGSY